MVLKKLSETVSHIQKQYPDDEVEVWSQDEARFGLKPVLRRMWAVRGERPKAIIKPAYEWLWLYAATNPVTGEVFWLSLPWLNAEMVQLFLNEFALVHAGAGKRIVMVWDQAPAHQAKGLVLPERVTVVSVPAYTLELNPKERVWPLVKEVIANRSFEDIKELEETVCIRCNKISSAPEKVAALTKYGWWRGS